MLFSRDYFFALVTGFLLDILFGDPLVRMHPIALIGRLISFLEGWLYPLEGGTLVKPAGGDFSGKAENATAFGRGDTGKAEGRWRKTFFLFLRGLFLVILVTGITVSVSCLLIYAAGRLSQLLLFIVMSFMTWQCLAVKSLKKESMKVYFALEEGADARKLLSNIVGRDTENLNQDGIIRAAVEAVAESTCDGVVAPLFFLILGGPAAGFFYKAVNTMDSMIGYRNEHYEYFGKAAARLDDIMNYIPARLAALLMIAAAFIGKGFDGRAAFNVWLRDRGKSASPNAGQTEAAAAGALKLRLSGDAVYKGVTVHKEFIGAEFSREPVNDDIRRINILMYMTATILMLLAAVVFISLAAVGYFCFP